ncbi:MAG: MBOAT family protein [Proteobacteria bacterium]|nr:MBOAT family protein [Pseudomonadota bacterium]
MSSSYQETAGTDAPSSLGERGRHDHGFAKMLFNSPEFIFLFLPAAIVLHFYLARHSIDAAILAAALASLAFYAWWSPAYALLPAGSIAANFCLANHIANTREPAARRWLFAGLAANLAVLGYYKYAGFLMSLFDARTPAAADVPLALSFTTFVQIAMLIDIHRRRAPLNFRHYALFVLFFPHLIAGPIVRWSELGAQIADRTRYRPDWNNIALGMTIFVCGLGKKLLIADPVAIHVAPVFEAAARGEAVTLVAAWVAAIGYSMQLYFDFSGYSDMAVGLGLLFNLRLPVNFAAPLRATSIIDLWRRWHVTLSRFLRDFLYVPLGGARAGIPRHYFSLFVTMLLGGLWHGAAWTFIAWGAFHGLLLAVNHAWRSMRGPARGGHRRGGLFLGWLATFVAFAVGMVFFRAADMAAAAALLKAMAGFGGAPLAPAIVLPWDLWAVRHGYVGDDFVRAWWGSTMSVAGTLRIAAAAAIALLAPDTMEITDYREGDPRSDWRRRFARAAWQPSWPWLVATGALFLATFDAMNKVSEFLYYQF